MLYRMHTEYLTQLFLNNGLVAGRYCVDGRSVAVSDIDVPTCVVGTERDHVWPWRAVYELHLLTHYALTFVLTSGGHNTGIVSELRHPGRHCRCATREPGAPYRSWHDFVNETSVVDRIAVDIRWGDWLHAHSSAVGGHACRSCSPAAPTVSPCASPPVRLRNRWHGPA